jgi:hypothetical protein
VAETTLAGLKTAQGLNQLLTGLDLSLRTPAWLTRYRFIRNTRVKVNEARENKKDIHTPENLSRLEQGVIERLDPEEVNRWFPELTGRPQVSF